MRSLDTMLKSAHFHLEFYFQNGLDLLQKIELLTKVKSYKKLILKERVEKLTWKKH